MPAIVQGLASSCANPALPFFYQESGLLTDLDSLRFEVYTETGATPLHSATINTALCASGGNKKSTGYYVAPLDTSALSMDVGAYEILWYYKPTATSDEQSVSYMFEVLDPKKFRHAGAYRGYVPSNLDVLDSYAVADRQSAINKASADVERLTGRIFFPKYMTIKHNVSPGSAVVWLKQPIIGVESIVIESPGIVDGTIEEYTLELDNAKVFNRHIDGLLTPDDRNNPRITFATTGLSTAYLTSTTTFPKGYMNVKVTGVFGYTDSDNGPFGITPIPLGEVITSLAYKTLQDPLRADPFTSDSSRIKSAKTRDQQISFDTSVSASSNMTGDARLDSILLGYVRPPFVGVIRG